MAEFRLQPAYRQFYLFDATECPLYPENVEDSDLWRGVKAVPFLIAVYSRSELEVLLSVSCDGLVLAPENWEHIVEAPLEVPSGTVLLATPETFLPDAQRFSVAPGSYRVSIASCGASAGTPEKFAIGFALSGLEPVRVVKDGGLHA